MHLLLTRFIGLLLFLLGPGFALAQYKPSYTVLKEHIRVDVKADGSNRYQMERVIRIDTPTGVEKQGEQRFGYVGSLETVEIVEAYT